MRRMIAPLSVALTLAAPVAAQEWEGAEAAFFGVTFIDTSTEGEINGIRPDETARTELLADYIAEALAAEGLVLVDLAPVRVELDRTLNPAKCNGCDIRMAQELGAEYSVVSEIQKVSNLILAINIYIRDAETGAQVAGQAVDIRGNNDDSWLRGARYILTRNIFPDQGE